MQEYSRQFLEISLRLGALRFGEFTLKSGRISPYFFNAGLFNDGASLHQVGSCYAACALHRGLHFDMLFGPAYKGIPLATTMATALHGNHHQNSPVAFNRKEAKDHGEGGEMIGAPLAGRVLIVDDVISAGTAIGESIEIIHRHGARVAGALVGLDRQERGSGDLSAIEELRRRHNIEIISVASLQDLLVYAGDSEDLGEVRSRLEKYRKQWGC